MLTKSQLRHAIGLAYTYPENEHKTMDPELAEAIVKELGELKILNTCTTFRTSKLTLKEKIKLCIRILTKKEIIQIMYDD